MRTNASGYGRAAGRTFAKNMATNYSSPIIGPPIVGELAHIDLFHYIFWTSIADSCTFMTRPEAEVLGKTSTFNVVLNSLKLKTVTKGYVLEFNRNSLTNASAVGKIKTPQQSNHRMKDIFDYFEQLLLHTLKENRKSILSRVQDSSNSTFTNLCTIGDINAPGDPKNFSLYFYIFSILWDMFCISQNFDVRAFDFVQNDVFCKLHSIQLKSREKDVKLTSPNYELNSIELENIVTGTASLLFETSEGQFFMLSASGQHSHNYVESLLLRFGSGMKNMVSFPLSDVIPPNCFRLNNTDCILIQFSEAEKKYYGSKNPDTLRGAKNLKVYDFPKGQTKNKFDKDKTFALDFGFASPTFVKNYGTI